MSKVYVLYHGGCLDGFGAAYAAWLKFGDDPKKVEYIPVSYAKAPPEMEPESEVYILDFSYPRPILQCLVDQHKRVTIIDHHKSAAQELQGELFEKSPGHDLEIIFDMEHSGAVLAWHYFHKAATLPLLFSYLQDRDLWMFKLEKSREMAAALKSMPMDFNLWDTFGNQRQMVRLMDDGAAILRHQNKVVDEMCRFAHIAVLHLTEDTTVERIKFEQMPKDMSRYDWSKGHPVFLRIPAVNATAYFSEVGHRLGELYPEAEAAGFYSIRVDGRQQWGLRTHKQHTDCSIIAQIFKGGGHRSAAGFIYPS